MPSTSTVIAATAPLDLLTGTGRPAAEKSSSAITAAPSWYQSRFSVTLPPPSGPTDRRRTVTNAVTNGLAPLLGGVDVGIGLLQVLNSTASLTVGPSVAPADNEDDGYLPSKTVSDPLATAAVALTLRNGKATWGTGQELWLCLLDPDEDGLVEREVLTAGGKRGSSRYDFLVLWSATGATGAAEEPAQSRSGAANDDGGGFEVSVTGGGGAGGSTVARGAAGEGLGRGLGPSGGHVVGELRPLNEFSAARQKALNEVRGAVLFSRVWYVLHGNLFIVPSVPYDRVRHLRQVCYT